MSSSLRPVRLLVVFLLLAIAAVLPAAAQSYTFTHFAGPTGGPGNQDGNGTSARLNGGQMVIDPAGTALYMYDGSTVRRYVFATGEITTLAGAASIAGNTNGTDWNARFSGVGQIAFDGNGRLILVESNNRQVRAVTPWGTTSTVAGASSNPACQNGSTSQAGFNNPQGLLVDRTTGTMYVADTWTYTIRKIANGVVSTLAGSCNSSGWVDGTATAARFYEPTMLAFDPAGNIIVADTKNYRIRKVTPAGVTTTIVGSSASGGEGYTDGFASSARIEIVYGMAYSPSGELYFSDPFNHAIRKWTPGTNNVSTVFGDRNIDNVVDGPVATARTKFPTGLVFDASGNLYFMDSGALRRLTTGGIVSTIAGSYAASGTTDGVGSAARFNSPRDTALDAQGNIYVTDGINGTIRRITPGGVVTTFAGIPGQPGVVDGPPGVGKVALSEALDVDSQGNVYFMQSWYIRKIAPDGTISSFAGNPSSTGYLDGVGAAAKFNYPYGLCVGPADELYVADTSNHVIRKVLPDGTVSTLAGTAGSASWQDGTGSAARFWFPSGCVYSGGFLYVADEGNNRIRKVTLTGTVSTVAGGSTSGGTDSANGLSARFTQPWGISADAAGHLFVLEYGRATMREIFPATNYSTATLGPGFSSAIDGTGSDAGAYILQGFASDPNGTLYIPEAGLNGVRKAVAAPTTAPAIDLASAPTGQVRTLSVTGAAPASVLWEIVRRPIGSDPTATALTDPTSQTPQFTPDVAGRYRLRLTADGPSGIAIRIVDFTATCPSVPTPAITPSQTGNLCPGTTVTLDAGAGYTGYLWSTGAMTRTITVTPASTTTYFVQGFIGTCTSASANYQVQVQSLSQNVGLTSGSFIACTKGGQAGTYALTESGTATVLGHQWFYRSGLNTNNPAVNIPGETGMTYVLKATDFPHTGDYLVSVKTFTSCGQAVQPGAEQVIAVIAAPTPVITPGGPTTFCAGGSVTLTSSSASSYLWSTGATTQAITVSASGAYSVTTSNANGCTADSAATNVTVNPIPTPVITAGGPTTFCAGGSVTLTAPSSSSYLWSNGATTRSITVNTGGTYSVTVTSGGCSGSSAPVTVTVNAAPAAPVITLDTPDICPGGSDFATIPGSWSNIQWTVTGGALLGANGGNSAIFTAANSPATVTVTVTDASGCTATNSVQVPIRTIPPPVITLDTPDICPGGSDFATIPGSWSNIQWTITGGALLGANGGNSAIFTAANSPATVTVTVTDASGCTATNSVQVPIRTIPPPVITLDTPDICPGGSDFATIPGSWSNIQWTVTGGALLGANGGNSAIFTAANSPATVTVTVTDASGCTATNSVQVPIRTIQPPPILLDTPDICPGSSDFASIPGSWSNIQWSITAGALLGPNGGNSVIFTAANSPATVSVTVTDSRGCTATNSVQVPIRTIAPPVITLDTPDLCPGSSDFASISGSWSNIQWSITAGALLGPNGGNSMSFTAANSPATVTVTVTDSRGCTATNSVAVPVRTIAPPVVNASGPTTFCDGGSVTLTAPGGFASYTWSNGATGSSVVVSSAGSYSVTVTDSRGCSATSAVTNVIVNPAASASVTASGPTSFCAGGDVTLTASAGSSYLWSKGSTSQSITVNQSGSYSVTVTNASGCSATSAPATVTANAPPNATITGDGPTTFCTGGSVNLSAPAGAASYLWSTGATTQTIHAAPSTTTTYSVTITDANGCSAGASQSVNVYPPPVASITPSHATTFCEGGNVTLFAGGTGSYLWSTGATTPQITVAASGTYTLTVSNGLCSSAASIDVIVLPVPPKPVISADGPLTFCDGGSVTLTAPDGYTYSWSNPAGASTRSIVVTASGSYTVSITGENGCSSTSDAVTVTVAPVPATPVVTASGPTTFCEGGSVTLTAPAAASYLWSNGATTQSIVVTASGSYSVAVTSANGCGSASSSPAVVTVNPNPSTPTVTAGGPTTFCAGGSVTLTAPASASYLWSNGATTQSIVASTSGNYGVTVTNASGCSASSTATSVTVNSVPATPVITAGGATTFCEGGSVTLTAPAASWYLWSNGATTQSIAVTSSGSYGVTVTNPSGCSASSAATSVTVNPVPATPVVTAGGATTFCEGGSVTLTAPAASSYLWSNGATTQSIAATASGNYSVAVTNASGCSSAASAPIAVIVNTAPSTPVVSASGPTTFCAGGSVTLTAPASASYLWSTGATTQSIVATTSGSYTVTVTNASGCSSAASAPAVITVNPNPSTPVVTASGPTTFCAGGSVTLTAPASASYLWSNGATTQSIVVTSTGSYGVTVTNASGCSASSATTAVTVNANPSTPVVTADGPTTFCAGGSVTLTAPASASYLWSNSATTQSIAVTTAGSYSVTVTNASGCSASSGSTAVTVNANPAATISASGPTTFCAGGSVTLTASAGSSYLWSNGATTQAITVSADGSYSVTVTNASGCSATSAATSVTVNATPATPVVTAGGPTTFCAGGSVTLTAPVSTSYLWTNGATTQAINVTTSGNYGVTVTNASGCSSAASALTPVTVNAKPGTPAITPSGPTTFCAGGSVTLTAPASASYLWTNGATTQSINVTASGNYGVTVTNASGCSSAASAVTNVTVNAAPATPVVTAGGPTTFCAGGSVTLTAPASASYLWTNGATTQSINVTASGNYGVTVTNASGCSSAASALTPVTVNAKPATPAITPSGPTTFCAGGSVTLTAPASSSYLWSNGATTQSIVVTASGSYSVTVSNANGCGTMSAPTTVTVNSLPAKPVITANGPTTFCAGSVTLTAPAGYASYSWSNGATTQAVTISDSRTVTATVSNGNCSIASDPVTVTVNGYPDATVFTTGSMPFCPGPTGGSVILSTWQSTGWTHLWSTGETTPNITVHDAGTYTVTITNAAGCSATSQPVVVTTYTKPTAVVSGTATSCGSATIRADLTGTAPWSVTWSDGFVQSNVTASPLLRTVSPSTTTTYSILQFTDSASNCVGDSTGSATITPGVVPATPTINASGSTSLCPGGSVTLTSSVASSYLWSNGATTQSIVVSTAGNYTVTVRNASGCTAVSAAKSVVTNAAPVITSFAPTLQSVQRNHAPQRITATATGTSLTYQWYSGTSPSTASPISGATADNYLPPTGSKGTFKYWMRVTNGGGCTANSATATVTVN